MKIFEASLQHCNECYQLLEEDNHPEEASSQPAPVDLSEGSHQLGIEPGATNPRIDSIVESETKMVDIIDDTSSLSATL